MRVASASGALGERFSCAWHALQLRLARALAALSERFSSSSSSSGRNNACVRAFPFMPSLYRDPAVVLLW